MKICAVVCEYNPFHNGHLYMLEQAKQNSGCDAVIAVMSGNFTQRGEIALFDKYTRAKHAVLAGCDAVIELPALFAVAPAEIFASGAINIISSIKDVKVLAFGTEKGSSEDFTRVAKAMLSESKEFKAVLKDELKSGKSFAKARLDTVKGLNPDADFSLLENPNSILGVEYAKAILKKGADIELLPIKRLGGDYSDETAYRNYSSATAIRSLIARKKKRAVKRNVPKFVARDMTYYLPSVDDAVFINLLTASTEQLKGITDCTEGLENRIKALLKDSLSYPELISKVTTKRYTSSRIKRICISHLLKINDELTRKCLKSKLYLRILAVKEKSEILSSLKQSSVFPIVTRKSDLSELNKTALECINIDIFANDIYGFLTQNKLKDFYFKSVE